MTFSAIGKGGNYPHIPPLAFDEPAAAGPDRGVRRRYLGMVREGGNFLAGEKLEKERTSRRREVGKLIATIEKK